MDPATHRRMRTAHTNYTHTCPCGKTVRGNGGWASHRWACHVFQATREKRAAESGKIPHDLWNVRRHPAWAWDAVNERWIPSGLAADVLPS